MKYLKVRDHLRRLIADGLAVGSAIPSERELCEEFGVARMTVRQAVDALVVEGLVERVQGRGSFVARPKVDLQLRITGFAEEMRSRGMTPALRVLAAEQRQAPPEVAAELKLDDGERAHYLRRLRFADGIPMSLEESWVPVRLAPDLLDPEPPESLYEDYVARGLAPSWGEDSIEAVNIPEAEAELLGVPSGAAGLFVTRRAFAGDVILEYCRSTYRGDRYVMWVPVSAPGPKLSPPRLASPAHVARIPGGASSGDDSRGG